MPNSSVVKWSNVRERGSVKSFETNLKSNLSYMGRCTTWSIHRKVQMNSEQYLKKKGGQEFSKLTIKINSVYCENERLL